LHICSYNILQMKKLLGLLLLIPFFALAQKVINHTVGPKESLSSIGRLYNINGRELANYNKIEYEKGLTIGQVLKVPVKDGVVAKLPAKADVAVKETLPVKKNVPVTAKENGTPIYHTVAKKETLYHISTLYNKVPVDDIKKWNNLTSDALNEGSKLIVGYNNTKTAATKTAPVSETTKAKKEDVVQPPVVNEPVITKTTEDKKDVAIPVKNVQVVEVPSKATDFKGGFFKNVYEEQVRDKRLVTETGSGGVFKSTSGWEDGKYYCLHNSAPSGTVLKVTSNATGKTVYVKVLDLITDIKQNNGLVIRISNAAADALGVTDNKIECTINYSK
jgi:LysM repeat protein